jgi:hypothetical protein
MYATDSEGHTALCNQAYRLAHSSLRAFTRSIFAGRAAFRHLTQCFVRSISSLSAAQTKPRPTERKSGFGVPWALLRRGERFQSDDAPRRTRDLPQMWACCCPESPNVQVLLPEMPRTQRGTPVSYRTLLLFFVRLRSFICALAYKAKPVWLLNPRTLVLLCAVR